MNGDILSAEAWKCDLVNRGYTVEETTRESLVLVIVKLDGTEVERIEAVDREGIWILRERLIGGVGVLPLLTTTERDSITFQKGQQIINSTTDALQTKTNGTWT